MHAHTLAFWFVFSCFVIGVKMSKIIDFYRGECPTTEGVFLKDIMGWSDEALEVAHDYIQWLFPLNELSNFNVDAPILTQEDTAIFVTDPELKEKVKESFQRMLKFFKMKIEDEKVVYDKTEVPMWLMAFNHNMLRVTRIIKSLRLLGHESYAYSFHEALMNHSGHLSENTLQYWQDALYSHLWLTKDAFEDQFKNYFKDRQQIENWMSTPNDGFGGKSPNQMFEEGKGKELFDMLARMDHGVYS